MEDCPKILFAVLDWGLGHATRSIPLIQETARQGAEPVIASAGLAGKYLRDELPGFSYLPLPPYRIRYPYRNMLVNIGIQFPKLAYTAWREHRLLQKVVARQGINAVVSDNRFGCWSDEVPSVFLSHQLQLSTPFRWSDSIANTLNHYFLSRYDYCWIPDLPGAESLGGALSNPPAGLEHRYLGLLSRFKGYRTPTQPAIDTLALLSGPEPQRSRLERELLPQLQALPGRTVLVRGSMDRMTLAKSPDLEIYDCLGGDDLGKLLSAAKVVVCRSGYSSLMDLSVFGKHALLIPTPGQTEQEYLGQRLSQNGLAVIQYQGEIDLPSGLEAARCSTGLSRLKTTGSGTQMEDAVGALIALANGASTLRSRS